MALIARNKDGAWYNRYRREVEAAHAELKSQTAYMEKNREHFARDVADIAACMEAAADEITERTRVMLAASDRND